MPAESTPLVRPPLPVAKRVNRHALLVLALVLGLTAILVVVTMRPSAHANTETTPIAPPVNVPSFLEQPLSSSQSEEHVNDPLPFSTDEFEPTRDGTYAQSEPVDDDPYAVLRMPMSMASPPPHPTAQETAYQRAVHSSPFGSDATSSPPVTERQRDETVGLSRDDQSFIDRVASAWTPTPTDGAMSFGGDADRAEHQAAIIPTLNLPATPQSASAHLTQSVAPPSATILPAPSRYVVKAGTIVSGLLLTHVVSDVPGEILGQVSRDVYDSPTQRILLIPKGAKLVGTYDNGVRLGQDRLMVAWTQLILPDGRTLPLPSLRMSDQQGASGIRDKVDNHYRRLFGNALMLSAISAGIQLSQPQQTANPYAAPSAGQTAAGALGQTLGNLSTETIRRNMEVSPTISIRAGMPFTVLLRGDLVFPGPYSTP